MFAAPEIHFRRTQTTVVDMWSLFVTLTWTNNWEGIRGREFGGFKELLSWITSTARIKWNNVQDLQELIVIDHTKRATAAQMLTKVFNGEGLTTERQLVPSLRPVEAPTRADIPDMASFLDGPEAPPPQPAQREVTPVQRLPLAPIAWGRNAALPLFAALGGARRNQRAILHRGVAKPQAI